MKITFIRPNMVAGQSSDAMQPLAFAVLAARTPPDIELALFDERVEPIAYDQPTDMVALSVETFTARRAYQIADRFRTAGVPVVMGGYHPTFLPQEALQHADAVVIGDAEGLWEEVLRDAQAGNLQPIYRQEYPPLLCGTRYERRLFRGKRYAPLTPVQYGRGCRFACDFCSIRAFYRSEVRQRPVREVVAEIEALDRKLIFLVDDNIFADVQRAAELFRALAPLNIRWACQVSIDIARTPELLDLMAKSGCFAVLIGFESLDERNLQQMKKHWNVRFNDYDTAIQQFYERGIMIYGTFVFGYDYDTPDSFAISLDFALRSRFALANFNPLTPTPGTALYQRLAAEGRLIYDRWWLNPTFRYGQAMFHPRGMTAEQLSAGCFRARREFNRYSAIARRALEPRANCRNGYNLGVFLLANLISRREIYRKQNRTLGAAVPMIERETAF
jgi:radical SAM superfamily enzyme YgiQ (UPF0313 family)